MPRTPRPGTEYRIVEWTPEHESGLKAVIDAVHRHDGLGMIQRPAASFAENHAMVALDTQGNPIGFAGVYRIRPGGELEMHAAIRPDYRQQGLAKPLSRMAIAKAIAAGADEIHATTLSRLGAPVQILEDLGFVQTDKSGDYVKYTYKVQR